MKLHKRFIRYILIALVLLLGAGLALPENLMIPVQAATTSDWNHNTFWYEPWGSSGVHKGIDIFGVKGTPIVAASGGVVVIADTLSKGGNVVAVLGPKWRIHYYAHLQSRSVTVGTLVSRATPIGTLGDTGNAAGKPPHLHYSILSLLPYPWLASSETQGWKRMFYLDPDAKLRP